MHHMTVSTSEDRGIVKGEKIRGKKMSVLAKTPPIGAMRTLGTEVKPTVSNTGGACASAAHRPPAGALPQPP